MLAEALFVHPKDQKPWLTIVQAKGIHQEGIEKDAQGQRHCRNDRKPNQNSKVKDDGEVEDFDGEHAEKSYSEVEEKGCKIDGHRILAYHQQPKVFKGSSDPKAEGDL